MHNDDNVTLSRAALERGLIARVAERVTAAGRRVEFAAVERIVRQVLDRLRPAVTGALPQPDPAVLVFVVEATHGERDLTVLRSALHHAAVRTGARLLAAHREPDAGRLPAPHGGRAGREPLAKALETP